MKSWIRITFATFVLIGGTIFFGHWSLLQFDRVFDDLSGLYTVNTAAVPIRIPINDGQVSTTSPETYIAVATSTDLNWSFTFPRKGDEVYIGCSYMVAWQASTTINFLGISLIDAGTGEVAGPIASGLARENKIEAASQRLNWKVGVVWPGGYYIKVSKINDIDTDHRSRVFMINKMPDGLSEEEEIDICRKSAS